MTLPRFVCFAAILLGITAAAASQETLSLDLRTYPADASVSLALGPAFFAGDRGIVPLRRDGERREFRVPTGTPPVLFLRAPGYQDRLLFLSGTEDRVVADIRLQPESGPLQVVAEVPTGESPKSALFVGQRELVTPLLRDGGIDRYVLGDGGAERLRRIEPPAEWAQAEGFVEPWYSPSRQELYVSQMTTDTIHVFDTQTGDYRRTFDAGGHWPKVLIGDARGRRLWVSHWVSETVAELDAETGAIRRRIPVSGTPRGLALSDDDTLLWVCIFGTGDIEVFDTATGRSVGRVDRAPGAARHIVADAEARRGDGGRLYFSDMYHGTVGVIDAASRRVAATRRLGSNLNTIVLDPRGRYLYVSERGRNNPESYLLPGPAFGRIFVLRADTLQVVQVLRGRNQPTGLAVSPDGRYLAATDFLDDNLTVYRVDH